MTLCQVPQGLKTNLFFTKLNRTSQDEMVHNTEVPSVDQWGTFSIQLIYIPSGWNQEAVGLGNLCVCVCLLELYLKMIYNVWKSLLSGHQESKALSFTEYLPSMHFLFILSQIHILHIPFSPLYLFNQSELSECEVSHKLILSFGTVCANNSFLNQFSRVDVIKIWLSCTFLLVLMWGIWGLPWLHWGFSHAAGRR